MRLKQAVLGLANGAIIVGCAVLVGALYCRGLALALRARGGDKTKPEHVPDVPRPQVHPQTYRDANGGYWN